MKFNYQLTEPDILTHQLYILSQSKSFQKRRAKGRMFILLMYMIIGMFMWQRNGPVTAALFYVICLPLYFLYRRMENRQYQKHIANYVRDQYKDSLKDEYTLEWDERDVSSSSGDNIHKMPWLELESIVELSPLFILNFRNTNALIIPKRDPLLQDVIRTDLKAKAETLGVNFDDKVKWKWG